MQKRCDCAECRLVQGGSVGSLDILASRDLYDSLRRSWKETSWTWARHSRNADTASSLSCCFSLPILLSLTAKPFSVVLLLSSCTTPVYCTIKPFSVVLLLSSNSTLFYDKVNLCPASMYSVQLLLYSASSMLCFFSVLLLLSSDSTLLYVSIDAPVDGGEFSSKCINFTNTCV